MKYKCGCIARKILKAEREDYPKGTEWILDKMCDEHQKETDDYDPTKDPETYMSKEELYG